jgi:hypothetical protein
MRRKKIAIVGLGNAGIVTALHYQYYGRNLTDSIEKIDIYYDPDVPIEKVGQGSILNLPKLIDKVIDTSWYDNKINATIKTGILYENWGKKNQKIFSQFPFNEVAIHYQPHLLSKAILDSGIFNVIVKSVDNFDDIDSDYIFDCRGKHLNQWDDYDNLINPLNSALISRKSVPDYSLLYTKCVATPDGWCFVIPNVDSVSYGYLYNNTITSLDDAAANFKNIFDCDVNFSLSFKNYVAKNMWLNDRVILNGNRYCFLEPLEATSTGLYQMVAQHAWDTIVLGGNRDEANKHLRNIVKQIETFILWHYQFGAIHDTPFWDYAKSLPFETDAYFEELLQKSAKYSLKELLWDNIEKEIYGQWQPFSFKVWNENV